LLPWCFWRLTVVLPKEGRAFLASLALLLMVVYSWGCVAAFRDRRDERLRANETLPWAGAQLVREATRYEDVVASADAWVSTREPNFAKGIFSIPRDELVAVTRKELPFAPTPDSLRTWFRETQSYTTTPLL